MKLRFDSLAIVSILFFPMAALCLAQSNNRLDLAADRALQEYKAGQFADAERDCREIIRQNPSNILAQVYLGQSLVMQKKYTEAVEPFEQARRLEANGLKLSSDQDGWPGL